MFVKSAVKFRPKMLGPIHTNPGISKTAAYIFFYPDSRKGALNHSRERFQKEAVSVNGFFHRLAVA